MTPNNPITDDYVLPCDVFLPPCTIIRAGCKLSTLIKAMELEGRPKRFNGNPRSSQERAAIVAWLYSEAAEFLADECELSAEALANAANCIERGDHLTPIEGENHG